MTKIKEKENFEEEDLGIKIGSEEEAFWTNIVEKMKLQNTGAEREIEINKVVIEYAEKKIAEEEAKREEN